MTATPPWPPSMPAWPAASFDALLSRWRAQTPAGPWLSWCDPAGVDRGWQHLDTETFSHWVDDLVGGLQQAGVAAGDRVAWLGWGHPGQLALLWALARLGAAWVPLNHRLSPAEWAAVLADCGPVLLVHDDAWAPPAMALSGVRGMGYPAVRSLKDLSATKGDLPLAAPVDVNRPLLLVYTSGTTGRPKAAVHSQANLLSNMAIAARVQEMSPTDVVLTTLPLFHVGGLCIQTLPALAAGARVLLMARFDAQATLAAIGSLRPTLTLQVPATLQALVSHTDWSNTDLSSLRAVWAGSSLLPKAPLQAFHARGVPVCNVYGSTETGPFSVALPPGCADSHLGSCGWPAPGVSVRLRDERGVPVAPGAVGEICVRGPNVVTHYWPQQAATDGEGYFHSGDLAMQAPDGSLTVVGRAKDMIISGGENIYPAEIEQLLAQHPDVAECAVVGQADARWGEVAVACVVLQTPGKPPADWPATMTGYLDGRLARYKWPRRWVVLDTLPRTALGKVQKAELRAKVAEPSSA